MLIINFIKDKWKKWKLFSSLVNSGLIGKFTLGSLIIFFPISLIWLLLIPTNVQIGILNNKLFLSFLSVIFSFIFSIFLLYSNNFNFFIRSLIVLYVIYFALTPTINIAPKYLSIITQMAIIFTLVYDKQFTQNKLIMSLILSGILSQFPPFLIEFSESLAINIIFKFIITFAILFGLASIKPLPKFLQGLILFFLLSVNYLIPLHIDFQSFTSGFQLFVQNLWDVITIPLWIILAGDLVDEVGRYTIFIPKYILNNIKTKKAILIEIVLVILISTVIFMLVFLSDNFLITIQKLLPFDFNNYEFQIFLRRTIGFVVPIVFLFSIFSIYLLKKLDLIELRNRFNQSLFALLIFSFQILYSYHFTNKSDVVASLSGFPFLLLTLGLFWEPLKIFGQATYSSTTHSIILVFLLVLTGLLVDLLLVLNPTSVAQVSITYQVLGGIVVGFPILFLRIFFGWDYDEKFIFRNFFTSFFITLLPLVLFPNKYWLSLTLGYIISLILVHFKNQRIELIDYISIGLGAIAQGQTVWLLPLPIIPLLQIWLNNLYQNVPIELLSTEHFVFLLSLIASTIMLFFLERTKKFKNIYSALISALMFGLISYLLSS